jgi:hypothetical protein
MKISRSLGRRVVLFLCILEVKYKSDLQTRKVFEKPNEREKISLAT